MIGFDTIVYVVITMLLGGMVLGLLWWLIGYCERKFPSVPRAFDVIRIVFVIMVVLLLISLLMHLMGYPLVRFGPETRPVLH